MGGKVSLLLILGFSGIFGMIGQNLLNFSNEASENFYNYYTETRSHNIAVSGANMASNKLFMDKTWMDGWDDISIDGGSLTVTVEVFETYNRRIYSIGTYRDKTDTVIVTLQPKNFAQYGNFYDQNGAWWATGDTLRGPFHTNDWLRAYGDPVFLGNATTKKGVKLFNKFSHPEFHGDLTEGVEIPLEFDTSLIRIAAFNNGKIFRDTTGSNKITDVKLELNSDGTVKYSVNINNNGWTPDLTVPLNTLTPNGVIYVEKGNVFIKGTLNGRLSVIATRKGTIHSGNIHITDDLKYNTDPRVYPTSTDMLGLIAEQLVQLDFDPTRGDIDIHASIYSQNDGLVIEDYKKYPTGYNMNLVGGIIGEESRPTAEYKWDGTKYIVTHGYSYIHTFDERFYDIVPPAFPNTKYFKITSWLE
ncbi:MAG: DUF4900 domain-containing protein [Ignavibacteriaceae bacterium]|nr:DUF4900 domain-containing protein [Ignavibacteriaceae bacterium]